MIGGALSKVGMSGPWVNASLQHCAQLLAVQIDVMVGMDWQSADYDKAKALLTATCEKL